MNEASLHEQNCLITLTYSDAHLPPDGVQKRDLQLFFKRLRKDHKVRFYACGEYGENFGRPHYHALLFGHDFQDKRPIEASPSGSPQWSSAKLDTYWQNKGRTALGAVTFESAAYVARYCTKKITGKGAQDHYSRVDHDTGEIISINPEFGTMSRNPGIGNAWIKRFKSDVYPADEVIARGHPSAVPRYYDQVLEKEDPEAYEAVRKARLLRPPDHHNRTPARLSVREVCTRARTTLTNRNLDS